MLRIDSNLIWIIVNLLIFYFLIRKFLFKPVLNIIEKRKQMVAEQFEKADTANAVFAQISVGPAADFATVVSTGAELRRHLLFDLHACLSQISCPPFSSQTERPKASAALWPLRRSSRW